MISLTFFIIFGVAVTTCVPIWFYIAKKNPNPRFRPRLGELVLLAIIMIGGSAGLALLFTAVFGVDDVMSGIGKEGRVRAPTIIPTNPDSDDR
jgi:hypothetical protein